MNYATRINAAPAVSAPKSGPTKDVIHGRLLTALAVVHELESLLESKAATIRSMAARLDEADTAISALKHQIDGMATTEVDTHQDEIDLNEQDQWDALEAENKQLRAENKRLNGKLFAAHGVRAKAEAKLEKLTKALALAQDRAPSTPEERRAAMAAAREQAMRTGVSARAF
jgi:DNA repair exonuclease SbcCD ATPase subunit